VSDLDLIRILRASPFELSQLIAQWPYADGTVALHLCPACGSRVIANAACLDHWRCERYKYGCSWHSDGRFDVEVNGDDWTMSRKESTNDKA
jgi:hypothetical protein